MDLSKIADIAIVMIDASVGFEIETFEFLSLLKVQMMFKLESRIYFSNGSINSYGRI